MPLRIILLILALGTIAATVIGGYLYYSAAQASAVTEVETRLSEAVTDLKDRIEDLISEHQGKARVMAGFEELKEALKSRSLESLHRATRILSRFSALRVDDVCYLMDADGNTIASSNYNEPDSFVGKNYSFRLYFSDAMRGHATIYMAVGVTSHEKGVYFSCPVIIEGSDRPVGVAVIKASVKSLERTISHQRHGVALLVHETGLIFLSSRGDWNLNSLWILPDNQLSRIAATKQFGKGPWTWTGLERKSSNRALDPSGNPYVLTETKLERYPEWSIVALSSLASLPSRVYPLWKAKTEFGILGFLAIVIGAIVVLFALAQRDVHKREEAEKSLRQSEGRYRTLVENSFDGIFVQRGAKIIFANTRLHEMLGYENGELEGLDHWLVYHPEYHGITRERAQARMRGEDVPSHYEVKLQRKDGSFLYGDIDARGVTVDGEPGVQVWVRDITERMLAEESLKQNRQMLQTILSASPIGIAYAEEGKIKWANPTMARMFGDQPKHDWSAQEVKQFYASDEEYVRVTDLFRRNLREGKPTEMEAKFRRSDGSVFDGRIRTNAVDPSNPRKGTITAITDISARKEAEAALRQSEEKHRAIVENMSEGYYEVDLAGNMTFCNESIARMLGYTTEEMIGMNNREYMDADAARKVYRAFNSLFKGERAAGTFVDWELVGKDGSKRSIEASVSLIKDLDGNPCGFRGVVTDVTDRKKAEEERRQSQERYRHLVENANDVIFTSDANGYLTLVNSTGLRLSGYSEEEIVGKHYLDLILPEHRAAAARFYGGQFAKRIPHTYYEYPFATKEGESRWFGQSTHMVMEGDKVTGFQSIARDITDRKKAEEALGHSEERYRLLAENSLTGVFIHQDGAYVYANERFAQITDYPVEELIGRGFLEVVHPEDREKVKERAEKRLKGESVPPVYELRLLCKNGDTKWAQVMASTIKYRDHEAIMGNMVDLTERKKAERERESLRDQLFQAQKMESIGTLSGGIAHDFNNLLTIINGYAELILSERMEDDPIYADLQTILQTGRKGAELVQRLLMLSKKGDSNPQPLDLNRTVDNSVALMRRTFPKIIEIETIFGKGLGMVNADAAQIEQVLMNLGMNAMEAMPEGGKLTIETRDMVVDEAYCGLHPGAKPGRHVLMEISDTGRGMGKEIKERIFDPFFTTKGWDFKKGTGLGLSVSKGIVEQHGGWLTCESEPGKGTRFTIYLPVMEAASEHGQRRAETGVIPGNQVVLLVDDEEYLRDLGKRILERSGYTVITAADGQEALDIYAKEQSNIGLVVLDLMMPKMSGEKCLEELLKINPGVRVIVSSGHSLTLREQERLAVYAKGFVNKPYRVEQLVQTVRETVG